MNSVKTSLSHLLGENPFMSYTYAYPHKTAYRVFDPPRRLSDLWAEENRQSLFLYFHVPFCEMRCGFCNLFTMVNNDARFEQQYLQAMVRHAERTRMALGDAQFSRMAIGGGTPTYLDVEGLTRLFDVAEQTFGVDHVPISVETSPLTATREKLSLLRERGVNRISIGIQSFMEAEVNGIGRAQKNATVEKALRAIRDTHFDTLNLDLIYGLPGQTVESWSESIRIALSYSPEELYIYPLYVRPLTGLDRMGLTGDQDEDNRLACYRTAREMLLNTGYTQVTMRMFRAPHAPAQEGPVYCVQDDGMVGLGCGARSYTRTHHYSSEYAVSKRGVHAILADYIQQPIESFDFAAYGIELTVEEQQRRYVIKSILESDGLDVQAYHRRFGSKVWTDLPQLYELLELDLAEMHGSTLRLNAKGLEFSDTIGPWLYSAEMSVRMRAYELR
jgi:oxygen-independent coproporphyrinogen III oxidase